MGFRLYFGQNHLSWRKKKCVNFCDFPYFQWSHLRKSPLARAVYPIITQSLFVLLLHKFNKAFLFYHLDQLNRQKINRYFYWIGVGKSLFEYLPKHHFLCRLRALYRCWITAEILILQNQWLHSKSNEKSKMDSRDHSSDIYLKRKMLLM